MNVEKKKQLKKMAKPGDRVRFLNATGGGTITKLIDNKTALVEDEDGFESPYLIKDLVVVLPAGHQAAVKGASIMFDQKAYDEGKKSSEPIKSKEIIAEPEPQPEYTPEETPHGDSPSVILAFEPDNLKKLGNAKFTAVLVNDSNYFIDFTLLRRAANDRGWELVFNGSVNPNELIDMAVISLEELPDFERIVLQGILYKKDKAFSVLPPLNVRRKLDLTKFHKLHCFRESRYFDSPVLEYPLVNGGLEVEQGQLNAEDIKNAILNQKPEKDLKKELIHKYKVDNKRNQKPRNDSHNVSPFKLLPLIEVDLHIGVLTDTTVGMEPKDMLELQLSEVRKTMLAHSKRKGQKIVFIHGKGEGVLRKAVLDFLKKEYPTADLQDASFREYGFGATLVTI